MAKHRRLFSYPFMEINTTNFSLLCISVTDTCSLTMNVAIHKTAIKNILQAFVLDCRDIANSPRLLCCTEGVIFVSTLKALCNVSYPCYCSFICGSLQSCHFACFICKLLSFFPILSISLYIFFLLKVLCNC